MKVSLLCSSLLLLSLAHPTFSQNSGSGRIQGLLLTDDNKSVKGGIVTATQVNTKAPTTAGAHGTSQPSANDGSFSVPGLPAGSYNICVNVPGSELLDPCRWTSPIAVTLTSGQILSGLQIKLKKGTTVQVHLDDPGQFLATNEGKKPGAHLLVGVWTNDGLFHAAPISTKGNATRDLSLVVPLDTSLQLSLFSSFFQLADSKGNSLNKAGALIPLQFSSQTPPQAPTIMKFTVSGVNPGKN